MRISRIELSNFRNLQAQVVEAHPRLNLIAGDNGQGKTNLLEAIYLVATLTAFRARSSQELIRFGEEQARVRAALERQEQKLVLEVQLVGNRKIALLDGKALRSHQGYLGKLNAVLFTPEELRLPSGAPAERRRLIDQAIVAVWPAYREVSRSYHKVLKTRNTLLKQRTGGLEQLLAVYERQLSELGAKIVAGRVRYLRAIRPLVAHTFNQVSRSGITAELRYLSRAGNAEAAGELGALARRLSEQLEQSRREDIARQTTTCGPHTDDVDFRLDGKSCRSFGSQGQVRALVLSFKISQIIDIYDKVGVYPTLLLDDVSSELDNRRNSYLLEFISEIPCQVFLTTARGELVQFCEDYQYLHIDNGQISRKKQR